MQHLSTAFLTTALVIVVKYGGAIEQRDIKADQIALELKTRSVAIVNGPKYVNTLQASRHPNANYTYIPEVRPPSKPPIKLTAEKQKYLYGFPPNYYSSVPNKRVSQRPYSKPLNVHPSVNSVYNYPRVIPLSQSRRFYNNDARTSLVFAASTGKPSVATNPKFSLPVQTVNGIRTDTVRPPKTFNTTTSTTTTATTTTQRILRTKRIWPKRLLEKMNATAHNITSISNTTKNANTTETDQKAAATNTIRVRIIGVVKNDKQIFTTPETTTRGYRRVTRVPKHRVTTPAVKSDQIEPNDWIPIVPSHYSKIRHKREALTEKAISKRSAAYITQPRMIRITKPYYLKSYRANQVEDPALSFTPAVSNKRLIFYKRRRQLNPRVYSASSSTSAHAHPLAYSVSQPKLRQSPRPYDDANFPEEQESKIITRVKHHHHHHHHRYIKKVEVPKPYPVEKKVPVPVPVEKIKVLEKQVPVPVTIKVPQPVPIKVVEKEYVPKPFPVVQHVPVKVPIQVPVRITVPVDRPFPVPVEKKVPYPVPIKVLVPQPYPVERKVPYPVEVKVKEPVEVIKHVAVGVPYPQPYPVKVPHPVPVTIEKKVPVPVEVRVPQRVKVEKKVPIYVPRPYPVEKKVMVKVPYPVKVPVKVPVEIPVYIHRPYEVVNENSYDNGVKNYVENVISRDDSIATKIPYTVTIHGNTGFAGFQSRSDNAS